MLRTLFILLLFLPLQLSFAQSNDTLYVAFWNLQNLFDTIDDPQKNDEEFLPESDLEWTQERLDKKMYNQARVIRSMNNGKGPDILGVCEVENQMVLDSMVNKFLSDLDYKIAYLESPDNRSIDNGLLYRKSKFELLNIQADTVHLSDNWQTRLIFGVNLLTENNEKLTVFVNHWPSRSGGQLESEPNRIEAASTLRKHVERIFEKDKKAKIIIIGDFNDEPANTSLLETLKANPVKCDSLNADFKKGSTGQLYNLAYTSFEVGLGSYKYKDDWNMLDQIIVSGSLLTNKNFSYLCKSFEVYKPYFIVTHSGKYEGTPFPTYGGKRYLGGYSDHFPVRARFVMRKNIK